MMHRSLLRGIRTLLTSAALVVFSASVFAISDVLETPAMKSELADDSLLMDVAEAGDRLVAVGTRGHIIYSDDQGESWSQASVPIATLINAVHFPSATTGYAVGHGATVLKTTDGGENWRKVFDGYRASELVIQRLKNEIAALEEKIEQAPESEKADLEWKLEGLQFTLEDAQYDAEVGPWKPLLDVWFADADTGFVMGAYGLIFRTDDGGKTWENWGGNIKNPNRFHYNAVTRIKGGALVIAGEAGNLFLSTNGGDTWETLDSPYTGSFFGVTGTGNVNEIIVFGLKGTIYRSTNLGKDWTRIPVTTEATINNATVGSGGHLILVGQNGAVLVSDNAGQSFRVYTREDRESLLAAYIKPNQSLLLMGEAGVVHADANGKSAE